MVYLNLNHILIATMQWEIALEREIHDLMSERDEWEGTIPWHRVVRLPRGLTLEGKASGFGKDVVEEELRRQLGGTYTNGTPKYHFQYDCSWQVQHQCPCGNVSCDKCIIPSRIKYKGDMMHDGIDLEVEFLQVDPLPIAQARTWWTQRAGSCQININITSIEVTKIRKWSDFCTFPYGQKLYGYVDNGKEIATLQAHFSETYDNKVPKFRISDTKVERQCPCAKLTCNIHIFPHAIALHHTFPLVLKLRKKTVSFEDTFRKLEPMTKEEAAKWFKDIPIKWDVQVGDDIRLHILCTCGQPHDNVPCRVKMHNCVVCHEEFKRADMRRNMCQNCHHKEMIDCPHCKRRVPRGHYDCKPLHDSHFQQELTGIYPPIMRRKLGNKGVCLDCGDVISYTVYARHQYRHHHGVAPGSGYSREYKTHKCTYCNYTSYDISNKNNHEKSHLHVRQHPCRHECGAAFKQHAAEVLHCRKAHEGKGLQSVNYETKRVGDILKKNKKQKC